MPQLEVLTFDHFSSYRLPPLTNKVLFSRLPKLRSLSFFHHDTQYHGEGREPDWGSEQDIGASPDYLTRPPGMLGIG